MKFCKIIRPVALLLVGSLSSCSTTTEFSGEAIRRLHLEPSESPDAARLLWEKNLPGIATDLSVARESGDVLVSLNPDPEGFKKMVRPTTQLYSAKGEVLWQFYPQSRVRAQSIRSDGSLALVSAYNEKLTALDRNGKQLWQIQRLCTPIFLPGSENALCYFDDDNHPKVAFEVLSLKDGRVVYSHAIDREVLHLTVAPGGDWISYALTGGQVRLLDREFKTRWTKELDGEALDVSLAAEPSILWVLEGARLGTRPRAQRLIAYGPDGSMLGRVSVPWHASSVKSHGGRIAFVYGNSPQGQVIGGFKLDGGAIAPLFRGSETKFADFSSPLRVGPDRFFFGMENVGHQIIGADTAGRVRWSTELRPEDAGFQMEVAAVGEEELRLVLGTDSGWLRAFRINVAR